jgi:hypothetical protein
VTILAYGKDYDQVTATGKAALKTRNHPHTTFMVDTVLTFLAMYGHTDGYRLIDDYLAGVFCETVMAALPKASGLTAAL